MSDYSLIKYDSYLKPTGELPKHLSFSQYQNLRENVTRFYDEHPLPNKRDKFLKKRDKLLIDFMFASGGRISDVVDVRKLDIDFNEKRLKFRIKKTKMEVTINLDNELCFEILKFIQEEHIEDKLFDISSAGAWYVIKKLGKFVGIENLHPHMFRHGLALYLMSQQVPLPLIQYRLGHRDIKTTIQMYLRVTVDIEKQIFDSLNIKWR